MISNYTSHLQSWLTVGGNGSYINGMEWVECKEACSEYHPVRSRTIHRPLQSRTVEAEKSEESLWYVIWIQFNSPSADCIPLVKHPSRPPSLPYTGTNSPGGKLNFLVMKNCLTFFVERVHHSLETEVKSRKSWGNYSFNAMTSLMEQNFRGCRHSKLRKCDVQFS